MTQRRWLRIIPVALIMYTISYVDRTNTSLALEPKISSMMKDLFMDDKMKGHAVGIFFLGYVLLQVPGARWAHSWSARKFISICLISWGLFAVLCGVVQNFHQFAIARFLLGVAESGVFPATTVLLANWFPSAERARANAFWSLCQPIAIVASANITASLLGQYGWRTMLIAEGALPFIWLPIWWFCIRDHPREAKWLPAEERRFLETTLQKEIAALEPVTPVPLWKRFLRWEILVMVVIYFFHNCQAYGCMTFFTSTLETKNFTPAIYGVLFAIPYALTAVIMVINSWHSDKTGERRGHVAAVYFLSGICLIGSVLLRGHFWISYVLLCFAIPGPFAAIAPLWAIPSETLPRNVMGMVIGLANAVGNVGGYVGPDLVGRLKKTTGDVNLPFAILGLCMLAAACLSFLLPKTPKRTS